MTTEDKPEGLNEEERDEGVVYKGGMLKFNVIFVSCVMYIEVRTVRHEGHGDPY